MPAPSANTPPTFVPLSPDRLDPGILRLALAVSETMGVHIPADTDATDPKAICGALEQAFMRRNAWTFQAVPHPTSSDPDAISMGWRQDHPYFGKLSLFLSGGASNGPQGLRLEFNAFGDPGTFGSRLRFQGRRFEGERMKTQATENWKAPPRAARVSQEKATQPEDGAFFLKNDEKNGVLVALIRIVEELDVDVTAPFDRGGDDEAAIFCMIVETAAMLYGP
jgi:hypothetical protein